MFTQAFLCYINRHAEITGEEERGGRRGGGGGETKLTERSSILLFSPRPCPGVLSPYKNKGSGENVPQWTFVSSAQRSKTSMKYFSEPCINGPNHYKSADCLLCMIETEG